MTIDQLIAELHKRREALVQKGYPEAQIKLEIVAAPDGRQFWASFYTGKVGPYGSVMSDLRDKTLYVGDIAIGRARSWDAAAEIIAEQGGPLYEGSELSRLGSESRDALFLPATVLTRRLAC